MLKIKGIDFYGNEEEIIIDTTKPFYIEAEEDKSNEDLEETDAILVKTNEGYGFWKRGSLAVEMQENK